MINYLEIIKTMAIPQLHKDIIVGCGLGDAFFSLYGNGNASGLFGRKIGVTGLQLITSSLVILITISNSSLLE
jgi:hypothetical protein